MAGRDSEEVDWCLQRAVHAELLQADASGMYTFSHDKIRESLYGEASAVRRRRLHGFIGRALEARPEADDARRWAELAFHFARSGNRARGASYARDAAERSAGAFAFGDAMAHYRTTLDLIDAGIPAVATC